MTEHFTQKAAGELAISCGAAVATGSTMLMIEAHELQRLLNAAVNHKLKEWEAQEPVAYLVEDSNGDGKAIRAKDISKESLNRLIAVTVTKLYAAPVAPAHPVPTKTEAIQKALIARAMKHPKVLEIMADCADVVDTENSAMHDPEDGPYDGQPWIWAAQDLRTRANAIRAEDPEIWEDAQPVNAELVEALETIIQYNRDHARDQYGDPDKAESWACIVTARKALANAKAAPVTIVERYALRPRWVTSSSAQQEQKGE